MRISLIATALVFAACNTAPRQGDTLPVATAYQEVAVASGPSEPAEPLASTTTAATQLTRVEDVSQVCMVNNQFMGKAQIPVAVEGKTYFGCCEMCKDRLTRDVTARMAKDPVSGKDVDKASAVIAKRGNGQVLYFENAQNLERFRAM
jgi:YHS domain-containing protein